MVSGDLSRCSQVGGRRNYTTPWRHCFLLHCCYMQEMGYELVSFTSKDRHGEEIYHTNVLMHLGGEDVSRDSNNNMGHVTSLCACS